MKEKIKSLISKSDFLSDLVFEKGVGTRVGVGPIIVNYFLNFLLRQNRSTRYPVSYRSTVVNGQKLSLLGSQRGTFASMVVSHGCYLQAGNGIEIGEGTIWAPNVAIISANHDTDDEGRAWADSLPVRIGRNCWIGANAVILPGVVIGDNCIVGAGAIVTKSFESGHQVLAGNPARVIRQL